jgi:DHA2 family multidrug resistance protein
MVSQQAWILAFADVFFALTLLFGSLIFMTVLIQKPKAAPPPDAAH